MSKPEFEMQILNAIGEETQNNFGESISVHICRQGHFQWVRITPSHRKGMTEYLRVWGPALLAFGASSRCGEAGVMGPPGISIGGHLLPELEEAWQLARDGSARNDEVSEHVHRVHAPGDR